MYIYIHVYVYHQHTSACHCITRTHTHTHTHTQSKAKCISDQFSGYTIHGDKKVSGELTLGEDIADSGGVKMAHHAWQKVLFFPLFFFFS